MTYSDVSMMIDGAWTKGANGRTIAIVNPATEEVIGHVAHAEKSDLDRALGPEQARPERVAKRHAGGPAIPAPTRRPCAARGAPFRPRGGDARPRDHTRPSGAAQPDAARILVAGAPTLGR